MRTKTRLPAKLPEGWAPDHRASGFPWFRHAALGRIGQLPSGFAAGPVGACDLSHYRHGFRTFGAAANYLARIAPSAMRKALR